MTTPAIPLVLGICCRSCRFWVVPKEDWQGVGQCHRYPPTVVATVSTESPDVRRNRDFPEVISSAETVWPETLATDFCGEFNASSRPVLPGDPARAMVDPATGRVEIDRAG